MSDDSISVSTPAAPTPPARKARRSDALQALLDKRVRQRLATKPKDQGIPKRGNDEPAPLSFAQRRLWFLDRYDPDSSAYNIFRAVAIDGTLDRKSLETAANALVRRQEALRTTFARIGEEPVQLLNSERAQVEVVDLTALSPADRRAAASICAAREARRSFDLATGPVLRLILLALSAQQHHLLLTMHHIVGDGWSMDILFRELGELYAAAHEQRQPRLVELPIQYADYAAWEKQQLADGQTEQQLAACKERLRGLPPVLELPTDRARPPVRSFRGGRVEIRVSPDLTASLRQLAKSHDATLFMVLVGAWGTLLYRASGEEDLAVGSPVAGRDRPELEGLVGMFVNTLVLRLGFGGQPTFSKLLERVRKVVLDAHEYRRLPFEKLVEELAPQRSLSHTPLFQVLLSLFKSRHKTLELQGLQTAPLSVERREARFDFELEVAEGEADLALMLSYSRDLFDRTTARRWLESFRTLLGSVTRQDLPLSALQLSTPAEIHQLQIEWNDTGTEQHDVCLHELFARQASLTPRAVALIDGKQSLTYEDLARRVEQLAEHLRVLPDQRIAICLERKSALIETMVAVLASGGAYVPLDPAYPAERLALMLEDSAAVLVVTERHLRPRLPEELPTVFYLDEGIIERAKRPRLEPATGPHNLAYLIYTSGSTGRPKGVAITHGNAVAMLAWGREIYDDEELSGVLAATSVCFDLSIYEIFLPLVNGGTVILAEDVLALEKLPAAERVRLINTVPSAMTELVFLDALPSGVRTVNLAGEPLRRDLVERIYATGSVADVYDLYGPSEDTTYSTWSRVPAGASRRVTIGRAISGTQAHVLADDLRPVALGSIGELYLGGEGVARGYLGRPSLTAQRFVPDQHSVFAGARMYHTGDRVRWLADGRLDYLGRADHQVKLRGFRIELGEIEAVLLENAGVDETIAVVREGAAGDQRLVAYWTPADDSADSAGLESWLGSRLPSHMVPAHFVRLEALPRTPNGKIDRSALPAPEGAGDESERSYVAPRTPTEEVLAGLWSNLLGIEQVGAEDNFFALGGHSLLATRLTARIRSTFGCELPVRGLFERPLLSSHAAEVDDALREDAGAAPMPAIERLPRDQPQAPSFGQERLWFLDQLLPDGSVYNIPTASRWLGEIDAGALSAAVAAIVARHEVLRVGFRVVEGQPRQYLVAVSADIPWIDLSALSLETRLSTARALASQEASRSFSLAHGPLWRMAMLRFAEDDHVMLLTLHHTIADGWSLDVLDRELGELYSAALDGRPPRLEALPFQYADYAAWQRQWLLNGELERQLEYWQKSFEGVTHTLDLPMARPRPALQTYNGATRRRQIPAAPALRELGRGSGTTFFMTLLAAFKALLARTSGQTDLVVGTPIANRQHVETEGLIGLFVNFLGLRTRLGPAMTFGELLEGVRSTALGAYAHQDLPFERLVEALRLPRDLSRHPLVQAVFILESAGRDKPAGTIGLPQLRCLPFESGHQTVKYDLALGVEDHGDSLGCRLEYNTDLFDAVTIDRLLASFAALLEGIAAEPTGPLADYSLLPEAAQHQIVVEWNTTRAPFSDDATLASLVEDRVRVAPDHPAVDFGDGSWTYGELNRRANRLANLLRASGVRRGDLVAVYLERSPEMLAAVLGVVKAGAAYVPLMATWPEERLRTILARMEIAWICTGQTLLPTVRQLAELPGLTGAVFLDADSPVAVHGLATASAKDLAQHDADDLTAWAEPEDLAYIIFTSGSTGEPKGVMVQHRPAVNLVEWVNQTFSVGAADRLLFVTALTFDLSVYDIFGVLAAGGTVRVARDEELRDPERLASILCDEPITFWDSAPAALQQLVDFLPLRHELAREPALRRVFLSGDWIPVPLPDRLHETFPETRVISLGGATEATIWSNFYPIGEVDRSWPSIPYGRPIDNARYHVLDSRLAPCPVGLPGDLYIGGDCLSMGYARSPILTASKYLPDPCGSAAGGRIYRTGDRSRYLDDGNLQFLGRVDNQVKVRGYRIELGEIEAVLAEQPGVREGVVMVREDTPGDQRLVAFFIPAHEPAPEPAELRAGVAKKLPEYMLPASFVAMEQWPLAPTGKLDRAALARHPLTSRRSRDTPVPATPTAPAASQSVNAQSLEERLLNLWREILGVDEIQPDDNFFDLGGHSLLLVRVHSQLPEITGRKVSMTDLFRFPTLASLVDFLSDDEEDEPEAAPVTTPDLALEAASGTPEAIAIIGTSGRFASATSVDDLWRKVSAGEEMIRFFSDDELRAAGIEEEIIADPRFVKARGALADAELFDAAFFGISPREAQVLDPQHRHFLECAYEALEVAGYSTPPPHERVGVYAGASANTYLPRVLEGSREARSVGRFQLQISNHPDYLPTRVSYKLDLRGPSVNVQTACSTSLVAVHNACQALRAGDCDMALAGGVSVAYREVGGHFYEEGGTQSCDGHTRTFDADAGGMATASGVGVVALKRLADAVRDRDPIEAVILGSASNNDGSMRAGFTAPGVDGQTAVIREAQIQAGIDPETLGYVEAHGTATALGDPIEVAGLTEAFRTGTEKRRFCALGSLKSNLGHLDAAAGVAGLIKTVQALKHRQLPPTLNFRSPNPKIDFESSPFYVNTELRAWKNGGTPRRAAVSAFGIGGTNAHAILEEAPPRQPSGESREWKLLPLSARTSRALEAMSQRLADALRERPELDLADVAYTLQTSRRTFDHRRVVVCRTHEEAIAALAGEATGSVFSGAVDKERSSVAFLLPGQGAQQANMVMDLYRAEPVVRESLDLSAEILRRDAGLDLFRLITEGGDELDATHHAQPALFAVELALAELWSHWGIEPQAMLGHSLGEYVAACLAGVFSVEDGLRLVATRGRLMQELPPGRMLAVSMSSKAARAKVSEIVPGGLEVATVSGPQSCVLSGNEEAITTMARALAAEDVTHSVLHTSHAFHSSMMDPVLEPFRAELEKVELKPPQRAFVSNLTGTWIRDDEATDPEYWCQHLRRSVQLDAGFAVLFESPGRLLLEVGPGRNLATAARQHPGRGSAAAILHSLPAPRAPQAQAEMLLSALGRLWLSGVEVDWRAFSAAEDRLRVHLPTYPFERKRFWVDSLTKSPEAVRVESPDEAAADSESSSGGEAGGFENDAQAAVAAAFSEILGVDHVSLHDDFFELGGSSLSALQLAGHLRTELDVELDSTALLEAPTVALLAEMVGERAAGEPSRPACLVRLQARGDGRPLFMVHPVGGNVYWLRDLAAGMAPDRPFYALRSPGLSAGEETLGSVEEMAGHYLEAVKTVQATGPYFLGGSSMGGSVAFEMARQLLADGEDVAQLILLDSPCLDQLPPRPDEAEILASVFEGRSPLTVEELRQIPADERLDRVLAAGREKAPSAEGQPGTEPDEIRRMYRVSSANVAALYSYEPKPLDCKALFFRAVDRRPGDAPRPELPWITLATAGFELRPAAGDHVTMNYPPNIEALARHLRRRLREEEAG